MTPQLRSIVCTSVVLGAVLWSSAGVSGQAESAHPDPQRSVLEEVAWLHGFWRGQMIDDNAWADLAIMAPAGGTIGMVFRWEVPERQHVHHAFRLIEEQPDGSVTLTAIHVFGGFRLPANEVADPTSYRLVSASGNVAVFDCVSACAESHRYELRPDGALEVSYVFHDTSKDPVVRVYWPVEAPVRD